MIPTSARSLLMELSSWGLTASVARGIPCFEPLMLAGGGSACNGGEPGERPPSLPAGFVRAQGLDHPSDAERGPDPPRPPPGPPPPRGRGPPRPCPPARGG